MFSEITLKSKHFAGWPNFCSCCGEKADTFYQIYDFDSADFLFWTKIYELSSKIPVCSFCKSHQDEYESNIKKTIDSSRGIRGLLFFFLLILPIAIYGIIEQEYELYLLWLGLIALFILALWLFLKINSKSKAQIAEQYELAKKGLRLNCTSAEETVIGRMEPLFHKAVFVFKNANYMNAFIQMNWSHTSKIKKEKKIIFPAKCCICLADQDSELVLTDKNTIYQSGYKLKTFFTVPICRKCFRQRKLFRFFIWTGLLFCFLVIITLYDTEYNWVGYIIGCASLGIALITKYFLQKEPAFLDHAGNSSVLPVFKNKEYQNLYEKAYKIGEQNEHERK